MDGDWIVDRGLGMAVFGVLGQECGTGDTDYGKSKEREGGVGGDDRRVLNTALAAVCDIVNGFLPLQPVGVALLSSLAWLI